MKFWELKLGDTFKSKWEEDREWVYENKGTVYIYLVEATEYGDDYPSYRVAFRDKDRAELHCSKLGKPYALREVREIELL